MCYPLSAICDLPFASAQELPCPSPRLNPMDWRTVQPHVDVLLVAEFTPTSADAWLQHWSDLASVLYEAQALVNRKVSENTADEEADRQFLILVEQIMPQAR